MNGTGTTTRFSGIRIWLRGSSFLIRNFATLLPVLPLLWLPFLSDVLHSVLIHEEQRGRPLEPGRALRQALSLMAGFLQLKVYYFARALQWGLVPVYGMIRDVDERLRWAMASNVVAFEGPLPFDLARKRCEELAAEYRGEGIRVLLTIPLLFLPALAVMIAIATGRSVVLGALLLFWYIAIPGSSAANSYLYVWAAEQAGPSSDGRSAGDSTDALGRSPTFPRADEPLA